MNAKAPPKLTREDRTLLALILAFDKPLDCEPMAEPSPEDPACWCGHAYSDHEQLLGKCKSWIPGEGKCKCKEFEIDDDAEYGA
jgi:hypothetical protein